MQERFSISNPNRRKAAEEIVVSHLKGDFRFYSWESYLEICEKDITSYIAILNQNDDNKNLRLKRYRHFFDIENYKLNASATYVGTQKARFSYNLGILLSLDDFFCRMCTLVCCDEKLLGYKWDGGKVVEFPYKHGDPLAKQAIEQNGGVLATPAHILTRLPSSSDRRDLAYFLSGIAFIFILLHEEGHYLMGHLHYLADLLKDRLAEVSLDENFGLNFSDADVHIQRVLELQADTCAADSLIDIFYKKDMLAHAPLKELQNPEGLMRVFVLAIGGLCLLLERARRFSITDKGKELSHYSPSVRLLNALIFAFQRPFQWQKQGLLNDNPALIELNWESASYAMARTLGDLNRMSKVLNMEEINLNILMEIWSDAKQKSKLFKEWKELLELDESVVPEKYLNYRLQATPEKKEWLEKTKGKRIF